MPHGSSINVQTFVSLQARSCLQDGQGGFSLLQPRAVDCEASEEDGEAAAAAAAAATAAAAAAAPGDRHREGSFRPLRPLQ